MLEEFPGKFRPYEKKAVVQQRIKGNLTTEGQLFVNKNITQMHKLEEKAWQSMTEEERRMLTRLTRKYSKLIEEALQ